jgi:hypothetical protein
MNVTLSLDDEVIAKARKQAEVLGTSVNQLIRDYLVQFVGNADRAADMSEFERISYTSHGDRGGWKFDREDLHER